MSLLKKPTFKTSSAQQPSIVSKHFKSNPPKRAPKNKKEFGELLTHINNPIGFKTGNKDIDKFLTNKDDLLDLFGTQKAEKDKAIQDILSGIASDKPEALAYSGMVDDKGNLMDQYKLGGVDPWRKLQLENEQIRQGVDLDNATQAGLGQRAAAESALAMRGGLSGGARERLAREGARNTNLQQQGVRMQSNLNRLGIESDAFEKNQAANQFNIQTQMRDLQNKNLLNANNYNEQMRAWAAGKQAQATAASGKK